MDRIERALELMVADREAFRGEHKQLLTAQILLNDQLQQFAKHMDDNTRQIAEQDRQMAELRAHGKDVDTRIERLVSAIGQLISKS